MAHTTPDLPVLYVKQGCPYCAEAIQFLDEHGISYTQREVRHDEAAFAELKERAGTDMTPTLDWHGQFLKDFGVEELPPFLHQQGVELEES